MGNTSSLMPREICDFKKIPHERLEDINIPERTENRHHTNLKWIIGLGLTVLILIPFLIYVLVNSDIKRILYGFDECGNICGQTNKEYDDITCSGQDMTAKPYLLFIADKNNQNIDIFNPLAPRKCVSECGNDTQKINKRCIPKDVLSSSFHISYVVDFFNTIKWQLIICCLLGILTSMLVLIILRYKTRCLIWSLLTTALVGSIILVTALWIVYAKADLEKERRRFFLIINISLTILALVLVFMFIFLRKKISLIILLIKEATKSIFDMPQLVALPITTVLVMVILNGAFLLVTFTMISYGHLVKVSEFYYFRMDAIGYFTLAFNAVVVLWLNVFLSGVEFMAVSGAVSHWYFARDKMFLHEPIKTSLTNTFKFHLGSAALGSLIIVLMSILRTVVLMLSNNKFRGLINCILKPIEKLIRFFSSNSYIVTAIHGEAFVKSGKRAARLLLNNLEDVIAINYIGNFIFGMIQLVIVAATVLFSVVIVAIFPVAEAFHDMFIYLAAGLVAAYVSTVVLNLCHIAVDTLLICFCEDKLINDGSAKPFYASRNLLQFVEDSKRVFKKKEKK
ncbi:hypothetical protein GWI33_008343 [Rhynchophorus ferrugineus]|uniref:Choline transporter-like protein n=1 Tax=Rhynchophorus ferrugineus TaxID=354439 RepID=A0A834ITE2_RHYFE|nr:hypothetical protein GWI33_008343 [Rhynchophorus ferrugineus]